MDIKYLNKSGDNNMELNEMINGIKIFKGDKKLNIDIENLAFKASEVKNNTLFFVLKNQHEEAEKETVEAVKNGAKAIVSDHYINNVKVPQILTSDVREAMALISGNFYGRPFDKLKVIGITGTNGKTTSTYMLKSILESAGHKVGLIGTNGNLIGNEKIPANLTTPDPFEMHDLMKKMVDKGCDYVVMEVSAHALYYKKVSGINFEVAIFTNLTQDHLDFFETMSNYGYYKSRLFTPIQSKNAVFNADDAFGRELMNKSQIKNKKSYAINNPANTIAKNEVLNLKGSKFTINMDGVEEKILINLAGQYNIYNAMDSATACKMLGVDMKNIKEGLQNLNQVDGRFNVYHSPFGYSVIIDYAHSPDGLENILKNVKHLTSGNLVSVFGCGGNRDKKKRPMMGEISGNVADFTVLTSDNPRDEEPNTIISNIERGIEKITSRYIKIANRKFAIEYAMNTAKVGDVIVIAGKGAEDYQEINGVKHHFSDKEVVEGILKKEERKVDLTNYNQENSR